jgi:hypothetical protein
MAGNSLSGAALSKGYRIFGLLRRSFVTYYVSPPRGQSDKRAGVYSDHPRGHVDSLPLREHGW